MAQYYVSAADAGVLDLFTHRVGSGTFTLIDDAGVPAIETYTAANDRNAWSFDPAGQPTDVELFSQLRYPASFNSFYGHHMARQDGTLSADISAVTFGRGDVMSRIQYTSGSAVIVHSTLSQPATAWHYRRVRFSGATVLVKQWFGSVGDEPVAWGWEGSTTLLNAGYCGLFTFAGGRYTHWADLGIGTNGDSAPTGPIDVPAIWTPSMFAAVALAADVSVAVTLSRPVATISAGAWLPLSGQDLHAMINDEVADLDTWIYADEPTTTRLELGNVSLPALAARALKYYAGGTNGGLKVRLYEGATLIAERTHATLPGTPTQYTMTLTEGELTALTDGTDMFVELEAIA